MSYAICIPRHYLDCGYILQYILFHIFCRWISKEFVKQNPFLTLLKMVAGPNLDFPFTQKKARKYVSIRLNSLWFLQMILESKLGKALFLSFIVFYAYIHIQVSDKNSDVLTSEIIYWVSLVLSSHFFFQLLGANGWSCSVSSP